MPGPRTHADRAMIRELDALGQTTGQISRRTGFERKAIWRVLTDNGKRRLGRRTARKDGKRRISSLSPVARLRLVEDYGRGVDPKRLALRYGLASANSVKVIVCLERKRIGRTDDDTIAGRMRLYWQQRREAALSETRTQRIAELWTGSALSILDIARTVASETGAPCHKDTVYRRAALLGLTRNPEAGEATPRQAPPPASITLPGGYVYRAGRLHLAEARA